MKYGDLIYYSFFQDSDYGGYWAEDAEICSPENDYYFNNTNNNIKIISVIPKKVFEKYKI